jgi:hypothetical protein
MPCPYFFPLRKIGTDGWEPAPRLPLGDAWSGECRAAAGPKSVEPNEHELCNTGYARGHCTHFPIDAMGDAVRFYYSGGKLMYVIEKDHAPLQYGEMDSLLDSKEILAVQARAFITSGVA